MTDHPDAQRVTASPEMIEAACQAYWQMWQRITGPARDAMEEAINAALALLPPKAEARPFAWARGVHQPGSPNGPDEWFTDFSEGDDPPDGAGWFPLYRA